PKKNTNRGYNLDFWWPENEIEVQNYERTVFNPLYECRNNQGAESFKHKDLTQFLRKLLATLTTFKPPGTVSGTKQYSAEDANLSKLRFDPDIGESHWAGLLP